MMKIDSAFRGPLLRIPSTTFLLCILPSFLGGQVPGQRTPSRETVRAEFINNILPGINEARERWMAEFVADRLDPLMATYTSDAMLVPPLGEPLYGEEAIRAFWEENLPLLGRAQTSLGDLDASGQMAMIGGTYTLERLEEDGALVRESGGLLTVYVQTGRRWFIRAQVFSGPKAG